MGFPIVRVTDLGAHLSVMITGSGDVISNSLRTHRRFDLYVCPIHGVWMTLLNCSQTVITNGLATAHVGSIGLCLTKIPCPNVTGSPNVIIGG